MRRLVTVTLLMAVLGIIMIVLSVNTLEHTQTPGNSLAVTGLLFARELGMALTIAAIVALAVEGFLSGQRISEVLNVLTSWREAVETGFDRVYATRQEVFRELIYKRIPEAHERIQIMGVCVSLFHEVQREADRTGQTALRDRFVDMLIAKLENGCRIDVLSLCRYPTKQQRLAYRLGDADDLYFWRERDEDLEGDPTFQEGRRLRIIANEAHEEWIELYLKLACRTRERPEAERKAILDRLNVREYLALPATSVYVVDDKLYVTPYLFKRHCKDVPSFGIVGRGRLLFEEYAEHLRKTLADPLTVSPIPDNFRTELITNPDDALRRFEAAKMIIQGALLKRQVARTQGNLVAYRVNELSIRNACRRAAKRPKRRR